MRDLASGSSTATTPFRNTKSSTSHPVPFAPIATSVNTRWRTVFHTSLFLLGFQPSVHATGSYANIIFDEQMFSRGANNTKVMEIVAWFLFEKLDAVIAREVTGSLSKFILKTVTKHLKAESAIILDF